MMKQQLELPNGEVVRYAIRRSARARNIRLTLGPRDGLMVVAPQGVSLDAVTALVAGKASWVARHMARQATRHAQSVAERACHPGSIRLPALGESWRVQYLPSSSHTVRARTSGTAQILVLGPKEPAAGAHAALRGWLVERARKTLPPWLDRLAASAGWSYAQVAIRNQRSRWGSCSARGHISLNCKLLFLPPDLVDYVLWHELCHLHELNHSARFWQLLRRVQPHSDPLRQRLRTAWETIPAWAHAPSKSDP